MSNAVTENFAAGVMERLGFGYDRLRELRPDVVYVSNCGFGQVGPYRPFKSWGPIAQAVSGLTHTSGLPGQEPAGWGYSYMDHTGGYVMAIALLAALYHQRRTGEGQWVDLACIEAGIAMAGPATLDETVNGRDLRADGRRALQPQPVAGDGAARHLPLPRRRLVGRRRLPPRRRLGRRSSTSIGEPWAKDAALATLAGRLDARTSSTPTSPAGRRAARRDDVVELVRGAGIPAAPVTRPPERCDTDADQPGRGACGRRSTHTKHGAQRVDGLPVHLSAHRLAARTAAGPVLGEDNERVLLRGARAVAGRDRRASPTRGSSDRRPADRSTASRVVELSHEHVAFAGKLLADLGADVTVVEPPGGSPQRTYGPFLDDEPGPERSLWWWHYNTSKRGVVDRPGHRRRRARAASSIGADVLLIGGETFGLDPDGAGRGRSRARSSCRSPRSASARRAPTSRSPTSRCSPRAARRGAAATTTTRSRPCAAAATRASTPPATGR